MKMKSVEKLIKKVAEANGCRVELVCDSWNGCLVDEENKAYDCDMSFTVDIKPMNRDEAKVVATCNLNRMKFGYSSKEFTTMADKMYKIARAVEMINDMNLTVEIE